MNAQHTRSGELPRSFGVSAVARAMGATPVTVRNWIRCGKLPAYRTPLGRWRVTEATLQAIGAIGGTVITGADAGVR